MSKSTPAKYRYLGRNGYRTRWRKLTEEGLLPPSEYQSKELGPGYGVQIYFGLAKGQQ